MPQPDRAGGNPTLRQVAGRAGVSEMTVSRVMRGSDAVAQRTRDRVLAVAAELGYVPNRIAGALASRTTNLLAIIVPSLTNHIFPEVLAGITDVLAHTRLQPVFGVTDYDPEREESLVHDMLSWRPSGLAVCGFNHTPRTLSLLRAATIPVAQMMDVDGDAVEINVGISHRGAGRAMAHHLLERGYKRIAFVGTDIRKDISGRKRLEGFKQVLGDAGLTLVAQVAPRGLATTPYGRELTQALLKKHSDVDAIHYSNDTMAVGGMLYCLAAGIEVPTDVALCGFAGLDIANALPSPLTTIRSPRREIGRHAARYILERIDNRGARLPVRKVLDFELLAGAST